MIYPRGLRVIKSKVEALNGIPQPSDVSKLLAFIRLANYYKKCIALFSHISKALTILMKNDQVWRWRNEQEATFQELKA